MTGPFFHKETTTIQVDKTAAAKFGRDRYSDDCNVAWSLLDRTSILLTCDDHQRSGMHRTRFAGMANPRFMVEAHRPSQWSQP